MDGKSGDGSGSNGDRGRVEVVVQTLVESRSSVNIVAVTDRRCKVKLGEINVIIFFFLLRSVHIFYFLLHHPFI